MKHLALIGCGHIHTPNFVKRMSSREDISVDLVWDHDAVRAASTAEQLKATVAASPSEAWNSSAIDSVVICSETNLHEELVLAAAESGKNIYAEKPLGMGAADAWKMAAAIEKAGVIFQTGYFMRGNPIHQFLKRQIAAGAFGKITRFRHNNCHAGALRGWFDNEWRWMADPSVAGIGGFGDLGTHSLDIMMWMLGIPEAVTATVQEVTGKYPGCDETGEALLRFPNGVIGSLAAGWVDVEQPVQLIISGTEGHALVCDGQLYFNSTHVEGADGKEPWTDLPELQPHAFDLYLDAVTGKNVELVSVREAALRSAVMEAMYESARKGVWQKPDVR